MANNEPEGSDEIRTVFRDIITSLLLLFGALAIEWSKKLFGKQGPPGLINAILNVSEIALFVFFLTNLFKTLVLALGELNKLVIALRESALTGSLLKLLRKSLPTRRSISTAFKVGFINTILVLAFCLVALFFGAAPAIVFIIPGVALLFLVGFAIYLSRDAMDDKSAGSVFAGFLFLVFLVFLLPVMTGLVIRSVSSAADMIDTLNGLLNRR
jgi:hypothetical protein